MIAHSHAPGVDEVLSTTRSVRRRLDFDRPVDDRLVRECVEIAMQAPAGSNVVTVRFVVVRDPDTRRAMGDIYRRGALASTLAQE